MALTLSLQRLSKPPETSTQNDDFSSGLELLREIGGFLDRIIHWVANPACAGAEDDHRPPRHQDVNADQQSDGPGAGNGPLAPDHEAEHERDRPR